MSQSQSKRDPELTELLRRHGGRQQQAPEHERVAQLLQAGKLDGAEALLRAQLESIQGDEAGWGDGILGGPARDGRHDIIAMLMRLGARVPRVSKWAPYYYFKHEVTAAFLLEHGMNPNPMNWHRFTLLHHMAAEGESPKRNCCSRTARTLTQSMTSTVRLPFVLRRAGSVPDSIA